MPMTYELLAFQADVLDDLERVRIANQNRLRQLTRVGTDKDGLERGFGMDESDPDVARLAALVDALKQLEHDAELNLRRALRAHPLGAWVKGLHGVGEKQGARLIAAIGDPYWHPDDRPRMVSELWTLCGYGDAVAQRRRRGVKSNWSPVARSRAYLVAESCMKHRESPYRVVYDDTRKRYADAVHQVPCPRCGPPGKPAPVGSPLSNAHKHARALRAVSKVLLRDLWKAGRVLHQELPHRRDRRPSGARHPRYARCRSSNVLPAMDVATPNPVPLAGPATRMLRRAGRPAPVP